MLLGMGGKELPADTAEGPQGGLQTSGTLKGLCASVPVSRDI